MKKILLVSVVLIFSLISCKNSEKEEQRSPEKTGLSEKANKPDENENQTALMSEVEGNIVDCENDTFIIKIDRLKNDGIRYTSWNKPKTRADEANIVLYDGEIEVQGTSGGFYYIFRNGEWEYIIENKLMGESKESMGIFLKILKDGKQKSYSKMRDLTEKKNYDKKSFTKNDLIGIWWTPHYAPRKVAFNKDGTFLFDEGDGKELKGKYSIVNKTVTLVFSNGEEKELTLGGGKDNASLTLVGEGENFIK